MFEALNDEDRTIVLNAMEERRAVPGEAVITQGDDGGELFVIDSGTLDCHKVFTPGAEPTYLKTYQPGEAFGELSLLYNAPRAASITATSDSILWVLDRNTFNHIVKGAAAKKRERYEAFLEKVDLLENMDPYERGKIADGFTPVEF